MNLFDLVRSKDGSLSQTKLAAACFHFSIFVVVLYITWVKKEFNLDMWMLYAAVAVGHSSYDKTLATVKSYKDKALDVNASSSAS